VGLRILFHEKPITPPNPIGHPLAGYIARSGKSQGVHDDIFARLLALDSEEALVALSLDLLGVDWQIYSDVARIAERTYGGSLLIVSATHTHSAPATLFRSPLLTFCEECFDEDYYAHFLSVVEELFTETHAVKPVSLHLCRSSVRGVATDRNDPAKHQVLSAYSLVFTYGGSRTLLFNVGVHPTVLGPENLLISSDLVGYAVQRLKSKGFEEVLFFNGAAGNISTRFTRRSQSFEEARRLGYLLADQLEASPGNCKALALDDAASRQERLDVELEDPRRILSRYKPSERGGRVGESLNEGLLLLERFSKCPNYPSRETALLQAIRLGDAAIVAVPFELHTDIYGELARAAEEHGIKDLLVFSYSNGYLGYLSSTVGEVTYERLSQLISDRAFAEVKSTLTRMLASL